MKEEFDEKCKDIITYLCLIYSIETNKIRYNEMFKAIKTAYKMSKPTFNEHIKHLTAKKLLIREEKGKQEVNFHLNLNILMIKTAIEAGEKALKMQKEIQEELELADKPFDNPLFWQSLPIRISLYFTVSELRQTKLVLKEYLHPANTRESLVALRIQRMFEENLLHELLKPLESINSRLEKEQVVSRMINSLDKAIENTQKMFREQSPYKESYTFRDKREGDKHE